MIYYCNSVRLRTDNKWATDGWMNWGKEETPFYLDLVFVEPKLCFDFLQDNKLVDWEGEADAEEVWEGGMKGIITRNARDTDWLVRSWNMFKSQ